MLALVAVVTVVLVVGRGPDKHSIATPATAGGMKRDKDKEAELKQELSAITDQFKGQAGATSVKSALYTQDDSDRGPEGLVLFIGAKVKASEKNPADFVSDFRKMATTNQLKVSDVSAGEGGGKAICAQSVGAAAQSQVICAWATDDSVGEVVPAATGYDVKQLAKIMRDMRPDVEKTD